MRARLRREQSAAVVEAIRARAHQQRALPESSLGKAIAYMPGPWSGLTRCLDDPRIPLDNNAAERGRLRRHELAPLCRRPPVSFDELQRAGAVPPGSLNTAGGRTSSAQSARTRGRLWSRWRHGAE
ncbi:MAG: hypothetical protein DMD96_29155 [Candidatus Rokuibacteriota bacterium]|nr:MAG: hypothetical protein DMD96_29155 [Candidatus Rokubacteria bacterium]